MKNKIAILSIFVLTIVYISITTVIAKGTATAPETTTALLDKSRFKTLEPSFIVQQFSKGSKKWDDNALEAGYSFQYIIHDCELDPAIIEDDKCGKNKNSWQFALSYTGEFDFYWFEQRKSSPVINRISNPAMHYRFLIREDNEDKNFFSFSEAGLSFEHRSNGQAVDASLKDEIENSPTNGQYLTQIKYDQGDQKYFDSLSRGANYLTLFTGGRMGKDNYSIEPDITGRIPCDRTFKCIGLWASAKIYWPKSDTGITWGELAGTDTRIWDYDVGRIKLTNTFDIASNWYSTILIDYTIGLEFLDTDSVDVNVVVTYENNGWSIPILYRYHNGPMDRLSDYTQHYTSHALGFFLAF